MHIALIWILWLFAGVANATYLSSINKYSIEEGLPATTIYSIAKDGRGYFWMGTPSGLVRFDGYEFEVYNPTNDKNKTIVFANAGNIFIDSQERIWLGAWGDGAAVYDRDLNLIYWFKEDTSDPNALQSGLVQTFFEDQEGTIWLGTNGGGLAKFDEENQRFINYMHDPEDANSISHNRVWDIDQTSEGVFWIATSSGLNQLVDPDSGEFKRFQHSTEKANSIDHPIVREILADSNDNIWLGTETSFGLFNLEMGSYTRYPLSDADFNVAITRIREGAGNTLWVGTQQGLFQFDYINKRFNPLVNNDKVALLPHDDVRDIHIAEDGAIWVTTRYAGLIRIEFSPNSFLAYDTYIDLDGRKKPLKNVFFIFNDQLKNVWLGTAEGLKLWTPDGIRQVEFEGLPIGSSVFSATIDNSNNLWLGTKNGLGIIDVEKGTFTSMNHILETPGQITVNSLKVDSVGNLWIGTNHSGLFKYKNGEVQVFRNQTNQSDSISGDSIEHVFEDNKARMWFTVTGYAVNRLDPERSRFFRYDELFSAESDKLSRIINQTFQASDGTMWFAGEQTLAKLDDITDSFEHIDINNGLLSSNIKSILEDDFGSLWLSTDYGITQFKKQQKFFVNYVKEDGLHGNQFFIRSSLKTKDHGLFFGGIEGLTIVESSPIHIKETSPQPQISSIWVDGKKLPGYDFHQGGILNLKHNVKNIEIVFSALNFQDPENNLYRYKLINFIDSWSRPTKQNRVVYSGLTSGEYEFQVHASNASSAWSDSPANLQISIASPWWQKTWVRMTALLVVLLIAFGSYKSRTYSLKKQRLKLKQEVDERTQELFNAQKQLIEAEKHTSLSGVVAGVAHEINTPLGISVTAASNMLERCAELLTSVKDKTGKRSEVISNIENVQSSANMILGNLSRAAELIHSFKEVSVDQISQQKRQINLKEYLSEIRASLSHSLNQSNVTMDIDCPEDIHINSYPGAIAQMVTNLVFNATVHAFDGNPGKIKVEVHRLDEYLELKVCDDGKGIGPEVLSRIFEPFFTTKRAEGASGLGLQVVSNIVSVRLGGNIRCESELGMGTCFYVKFLANPD